MSVDPDGRCASLQLSNTSVAVIPFRAKDVSLATDESIPASDNASIPKYVALSFSDNSLF